MGTDKRMSLGLTASRMALGVAALSAACNASAASEKPEFSYFLPRTAIQVEIKQQLNSCEARADGKADIATSITVTPVREADPAGLVRLDAGSGILAKRTVKLELNPDGTLASFNSQSEGQAGPLLAAVAKFGFKLAAGSAGVLGAGSGAPPPKLLPCNAETLEAFGAITALAVRISDLETLLEGGTGGPAQVSLLSELRQRRTKAKEQLTATKTLAIPFSPTRDLRAAAVTGPALGAWFDAGMADAFTFKGMLQVFDVPGAEPAKFKGDGTVLKDAAQPNVIYRKGVPGVVLLVDNADRGCLAGPSLEAKIDCVANTEAGVVTRAVFPQFSKEYAINAGKGGLFGSRQAGVKFDANGVPVSLEYGSTSASADLASLAGTATDGVQTLRDAPLANLQRAIAIEEAKAKLATLRAADESGE